MRCSFVLQIVFAELEAREFVAAAERAGEGGTRSRADPAATHVEMFQRCAKGRRIPSAPLPKGLLHVALCRTFARSAHSSCPLSCALPLPSL
eukprot:1716173-Rhodomonas_salina.2